MVCSIVARRAGGRWRKCRGEAGGDERCIARHRQQRLDTQRRCPIEPGEHAGKRALATERSVWKNRRGQCGEPCRIAVGADRDDVPIRPKSRDKPSQHGSAADIQQRLVLTAHSPCATSRKDQGSNFVRVQSAGILPQRASRAEARTIGSPVIASSHRPSGLPPSSWPGLAHGCPVEFRAPWNGNLIP